MNVQLLECNTVKLKIGLYICRCSLLLLKLRPICDKKSQRMEKTSRFSFGVLGFMVHCLV